jgi:hypothetical protein
MSLSLQFDLQGNMGPELASKMAQLEGGRVNPVLAQAAVDFTQAHLFRLDAERGNVLGGARTHFYSQAARGTHHTVLPDGFALTIGHVGFRQRLQGGTIRPQKAKFLTIPAYPDAYGRRAGEFSDLRFAIVGGRPCLVKAEQSALSFGKKRKDGSRKISGSFVGGNVMYWLVRQVNQAPDPSVLPSEEEYTRELLEVWDSWALRQLARREGGG